jgi:prepilin-type N-terminal cleavage/methylation domain-containing protein
MGNTIDRLYPGNHFFSCSTRMKRTVRTAFGKGGFTLMEIIAVLLILAVVSALVISRGMATDQVKLQAEVDTLKGHLRFAQSRAMNDLPGTQWGISLAGSSYTLVRVDASGTTSPLNLPGTSSTTHNFAPISATPATVLFDDWGRPPGNTSITLAFGGKTITITTNTGFIP